MTRRRALGCFWRRGSLVGADVNRDRNVVVVGGAVREGMFADSASSLTVRNNMNILSLENVSKTYGIKPLFEAVSFGLDESDKVGVIGVNGSGKSTLLRVIAGEEQTDTGRVVIANEKVVAFLSQNPPYDLDQTVIEAVFSGGNEALWRKLG